MQKEKKNRSEYLALFWTFFKIGAFTFGGGYAMIPLIKREVVTNKNWLTDEDIMDVIAIAESTPGPFAINSATFVGKQIGGFIGALCATIGVSLPSFVIILIISFFLKQFEELKVIQYAFQGIRAGVLVLIFGACVSLFKNCEHHIYDYVIMLAAFILVAFLKVNAIIVLVCGAVAGLILQKQNKEEKK